MSFRPCFRSARRTFCLLSHIPTFVARILTPQATHNILLFSIHNKHFSSKIICSSATNRFWKQNCKHPMFIVALVAPATGMLICIINTSTYHSSNRSTRSDNVPFVCVVVVRSYLCRVATSFWVIKNNVNNKYRLLPERPWSDSIKNFTFVTSPNCSVQILKRPFVKTWIFSKVYLQGTAMVYKRYVTTQQC